MAIIAIVVEHAGGRVAPVTSDQVACATRIAEFLSAEPHAALIGDDVQQAAEVLVCEWGVETTVVHIPESRYYQFDTWLNSLEMVLEGLPVTGVVLGHTPNGMEVAPALAVRLQARCISGVHSVLCEDEGLFFQRDLFGGKVSARIGPCQGRWVVTVQPGAFPLRMQECVPRANIRRIEAAAPVNRTRLVDLESAETGDATLQKAKIVVGAGRGLGKKENLKLVQDLASVLPGAVVGGSRPVCDAGWIEYSRQIGLTGNTVRPKLYIACGVSGAFQHIVGMRDSEVVAAINKDPNAAIFNHADVAVLADLVDFLPVLTDKLRQTLREKEAPARQPQGEQIPNTKA
ncbi:MAG: electron transfer flavoprotein subunit alpha/FixB family protein [Desulfomonilaceae bacterium]